MPLPTILVWLLRRLRRLLPLQVQALVSDVLTADPKKLFQLGFRPKVSLREGLIELARDQGYLAPLTFEQPRRPVSIITGAAGGIGSALAKQMHEEGHSLLLIDIDVIKLKPLAESLGALFLEVDLSIPKSAKKIEHFLNENALYIDWMVNNAGIGVCGVFADADLVRLRQTIEVNCSAVMALTQLFIRYSKKSGNGTLINIGSSSGFQPLPFMAAYAASKSFVQSFTLAIMGEVAMNSNVKIVLVDPSGTDTNFQAASGVNKNPGEKLLVADKVAKIIMESIYRGKRTIIIGRRGQGMALISRMLPRVMQVKLWRKLMGKLR